MKEFIEFIVKHIVDFPERVVINEISNEDSRLVLELKVADNDIGKVIGKKGKTAESIRTLLSAVAGKQGKRVTLDIQSPPRV